MFRRSKFLFTLPAAAFALSSQASTDYGPAVWNPLPNYYTSGYGHKFLVIHDIEGYYASLYSVLSSKGLSVHYAVNSKQDATSDAPAGEVMQFVRDANYAIHARCWNQHSTGTEHEGFASNPAWYTETMYQASAGLQRHLCSAYSLPKDRNHIVAHGEKSNSAWVTYANANLGIDASCNTHTDPGPYWDWPHFIALITDAPANPTSLNVTPVSTSQLKLTWTDNATNETGFKIERALASSGPWSQIGTTTANITTYTNSGLTASTVYFYRVRAYNSNGDSEYSNIRSATTGNTAPILNAIGNKTITEGQTLTFTATATDAGRGAATPITDFEAYSSGTTSVMFQKPSYSGSTRGIDTSATNYTQVTSTFPAGTGKGSSVLKSSWTFVSTPTNWVRLTTIATANFPNPVIDLKQIIKFDIYCDKALKVAVGCRETGNAAGTAIGSDGGTANGIEWAGATNVSGGTPMPTRTLAANTWTTLQFNLPLEPVQAFAGTTANGILTSPTDLGTLEHLAFVPTTSAAGTYTVYMDNFSVVYSNTLTFSLDAGAPTGASIHPITGAFSWTPTEAQGPGVYDITVRVTDNGSPALEDFETITVVVNETNNAAPVLTPIGDKVVLAGDTLSFTNSAADADVPNVVTYSLDSGAPADATIDTNTGVFTWTPPIDSATQTNAITVRVSDAGPPVLSDAKTFNVRVVSRAIKTTAPDANGDFTISWSSIAGKKFRVQYKDNLSDTNWLDSGGDIVGTGNESVGFNANASSQRFYRIIEVP